jgi:hypothetical protein
MKYNQISVFFPAYNEEENIKSTIKSAQLYLCKTLDLRSNTGFIDAEIFIKAKKRAKIIQVGINHFP